MDSNTGNHYEDTLREEADKEKDGGESVFVSHVIEREGFQNVVNELDVGRSQNFKMRHAQGGQPEKFGEFIFDTIDKIVLRQGTRHEPLELKDDIFPKYLEKDYALLTRIRTDPILRNAVKRMCIEERWGPDMSQNSTNRFVELYFTDKEAQPPSPQELKRILMELYPNQHAPSDHPPCSVLVRLR